MKSANGPGDVLAVRVVDVCLFEYGLAGGWVSLKILWVVRWSRRVHSRVDHPGELLGEAAVQSIDACAVADSTCCLMRCAWSGVASKIKRSGGG